MNSTEKHGVPPELDNGQSWENAKAYAALLGTVPSSFSAIIRTLTNDQVKRGAVLQPESRAQVERLLKGSLTSAMVYFVGRTFYERKLGAREQVTIRDLLDLFTPSDLAAIVALIFLYRRCVTLAKNDQHWPDLDKEIQRRSELGGYVGQAVPAIGLGTGLLVSSIRLLGLTAIQHHDSDGFQLYKRHLEKTKQEMDLEFEIKRWSTTTLQIASVLLQSLGLGVELPRALVIGLDPRIPLEELNEEGPYRIKITDIWVDSLLTIGDQPKINLKGDYYPLSEAMEHLKAQTQALQKQGPRFGWLAATPERLTDGLIPELVTSTGSRPSTVKEPTSSISAEEVADLEDEIDSLLGSE